MREFFKELVERRELLWVMVLREVSSRYRQSLLGLGWVLLQAPVLALLVMVVRYFVGRKPFEGAGLLTTYAGVLLWTFLSNALFFATPSVQRNGAMLKKIYFPRQILVASAVLTSLLDFIVGSIPLVVLMLLYGRATVHLVWVPAALALVLLLAGGVGLLTAALAVYKRDIIFAMPFLLQFWMFLSPVFYEAGEVRGRLSRVYMLNPMAGLIESFRNVVARGAAPDYAHLAWAAGVVIVVLLVCQWVFRVLEVRFADVV